MNEERRAQTAAGLIADWEKCGHPGATWRDSVRVGERMAMFLRAMNEPQEINPADVCSVEASARPNRWLVVLWDVDGESVFLGEFRNRGDAEDRARAVAAAVLSWRGV